MWLVDKDTALVSTVGASSVDAASTYLGGWAYIDGKLQVDTETTNAATDVFINGFRARFDGRLCVVQGGTIHNYVGGLPVDADGRVVCAVNGAVNNYANGLPVDSTGKLCVSSLVPSANLKMHLDADQLSPAWNSNVATWEDQSGNGNDMVQATEANKPGGMVYEGELFNVNHRSLSYPYLIGADADAAAITGDIEVQTDIATDWAPGGSDHQYFFAKTSVTPQLDYRLVLLATGIFRFQWWDSGDVQRQADSTVAMTETSGARLVIKVTLDVDNGSGGNDVAFYKSSDGGSTWEQIGATVTQAFTTDIRAGASDSNQRVYAFSDYAASQPVLGKHYSLRIYDGVTLACDLNFDRDASDMAGSVVSSTTGETWTMGGLNDTGICGSSRVIFDGSADTLANSLALDQPLTIYIQAFPLRWVSNNRIFDGGSASECTVYDITTTPTVAAYALGAGAACHNNEFTLRAWHSLAFVANGASSVLQFDVGGTAATGNPGTSSITGFRLCRNAGASADYFQAFIKEVLVYGAAHDADQRAAIMTYLSNRP